MCDYSLEHVNSRPAKVGETLVLKKFENSMSRGFVSPEQTDTAVCLLPGTELSFEQDVMCAPRYRFMPNLRIKARVARFCQTNMHLSHTHHDAVEFPDGRTILLLHLCVGQRAKVLQLPAGEAHHHHEHGASHADTPAPVDARRPQPVP